MNQQTSILTRYSRLYAWPLTLVLLSAALQQTAIVQLLRYDTVAIQTGQWWRLFTAHWVHLGYSHWLLNATGLVLIWSLYGSWYSVWVWTIAWLLLSLGVSFGLLWWHPELSWYVGMSGVLHGILMIGVLAQCRAVEGRVGGILLLLALVAKLLWEQINGPLPGSEQAAGGAVIVDAHWYGALSGALVFVGIAAVQRLRLRAASDSG